MENLPYSVSSKVDKKVVEIIAKGDLNINHISKIKDYFDTNLDFKKDIKLILSDVTSMDLTFLQLIMSLQKTTSKTDIGLEIDANLDNDTKDLLQHSGFEDIFKNSEPNKKLNTIT